MGAAFTCRSYRKCLRGYSAIEPFPFVNQGAACSFVSKQRCGLILEAFVDGRRVIV